MKNLGRHSKMEEVGSAIGPLGTIMKERTILSFGRGSARGPKGTIIKEATVESPRGFGHRVTGNNYARYSIITQGIVTGNIMKEVTLLSPGGFSHRGTDNHTKETIL